MQKFEDIVNNASEGHKAVISSQQIWPVLISAAKNRQILRYSTLQEITLKKSAIRYILGYIAYYCLENSLPAITVLVVNTTGEPGSGFDGFIAENIDLEREKVFSYDWYSIVPPTITELEQAYAKHKN